VSSVAEIVAHGAVEKWVPSACVTVVTLPNVPAAPAVVAISVPPRLNAPAEV
jgi:hypothetical protein